MLTELDAELGDEVSFVGINIRDNSAGDMQEYWYHGGGCRSWLVAVRNTLSHEFKSVRAAPGAGAGQPAQGDL